MAKQTVKTTVKTRTKKAPKGKIKCNMCRGTGFVKKRNA